MPTSNEILEGLQAITNRHEIFAIGWHAVFYVVLFLLAVVKWKPSNRLLLSLLSLPLFSVAGFAWSAGNPFNGILFMVIAVFVLVSGIRANNEKIVVSEMMFIVSGIIMIVFGMVYPHFLETDNVIKYLYASPVGLIPCPTLSVVIGFMLVYRGFGSKYVMMMLVVFGLFYGLFGVFKLGVYVDAVLIFGAVMLGVLLKRFLPQSAQRTQRK